MPDFDLIVIGSGPAGEKGAAQAAYFGKKVALIERESHFGGAAANTGTLPSKTLRETALFLSGFRQRGLYGVEFALKHKATVRDFMFRELLVRDHERERITKNLERHHVTVLRGSAAFVDAHTVAVDETKRVTGAFFLIPTGSTPHRPTTFPFQDGRIYDSDTILNLAEIPASMGIIGGGVIGCEYACMFATLGVKVTLVEGRDTLLPFLDAEMSKALTERMAALGISFAMPDSVEAVKAESASPEKDPRDLILVMKSGVEIPVRTVLVASGRSGCTRGLNLEPLGIKVGKRGHIEVNGSYQTAVPHIYAAGDVIGFPALASTSMEQARIAMVHAFDLKYKIALPPILPYGIYTIPEISCAGETEETLREKKIDYVAGRAMYFANARGQIIGDEGGMLKLLFRKADMQLLGVHVIGEAASELVHIGLVVLLTGAGADLFIQTCFNYPTLSETYKYATYDALGARAISDGLRAAKE